MNIQSYFKIIITGVIVLFCSQQIAAKKFTGLIILTKGKVSIIKSGKKIRAKKNMFVSAGDTIITGSSSIAGLQLSGGITSNIGANSRVKVNSLLKNGRNRTIKMKVTQGSLMSRVKPGKEIVRMNISSPTLIAAVRGTEFSVNAGKNGKASVHVNKGKVAVNSKSGGKVKNVTVNAGEKITATYSGAKKSIMDQFEKNKFRMLDQLEKQKKRQFEQFLEQTKRNKANMERMRK